MSILNIILAPCLITAWLVFGFVDGLAGYINDNVYLIVPLIYIIFSLVFFLISYIIFFKRSKTKKRKIVLIIVGITILLFISPIIYIIKFIISYN